MSFTANIKDWKINTYSVTEWATMEDKGAVFLPAAGDRNETTIDHVGSDGYYWSSSPEDKSYVWNFQFDFIVVRMSSGIRYTGLSVRLVWGL